MSATILRAGFLTSVQDLGRTGFREFGVSVGGALDQHALHVANLLAGNAANAAGLEITLGGFRIRFDDEQVVAWCGGDFDVRFGSTPLSSGHVARLGAGEELSMKQPKIGCRAWLAISGGIDVPVVLNSRATDMRANFGGIDGRALRDNDEISLSKESHAPAVAAGEISSWSAPADWSATARRDPVLRVIRGVHWSSFKDEATQRFASEAFGVSPDSDRMGARLDGPELPRSDDVDLVSEAVAPGTIQVPPSGQPIVLLGDCQTIGGYPKIAHVITVDLCVAAQLRAGDTVRFQEVSLGDAHRLLFERQQELERFRIGLSLRTR
jgi:antagonist of KipI